MFKSTYNGEMRGKTLRMTRLHNKATNATSSLASSAWRSDDDG
jgi:hypothetical protein